MSQIAERAAIQYLCNPKIRAIAAGHMHEWMFNSDVYRNIFLSLKDPTFENMIPDAKIITLKLFTEYKMGDDDCVLANEVVRAAANEAIALQTAANGMVIQEQALQQVQNFISSAMFTRAVELNVTGTSAKQKANGHQLAVQSLNFSLSTDHFYDFSDDNFVEMAKAQDYPEGGKIIKSSFQIVNRSSSIGGYKYGDLIMVAAKPGGGKSTGMVGEGAYAIRQGHRVCHIFLGDMSEYDTLVKYTSWWTGISTDEIMLEGVQKYLTPEIRNFFRLLRTKSYPADTYDIYQVLSKVNAERDKFPFDMLIVDYDANIKGVSGDNMYGEGGNTYANLKSYGKSKCVVMVGSQVKPASWDKEVIPMDQAAESSKKPHHVDIMLTIGVNAGCPHLGTINIAKMRRGAANRQSRLHLDYGVTRLREVSLDVYNDILSRHKAAMEVKQSEDADEASGKRPTDAGYSMSALNG